MSTTHSVQFVDTSNVDFDLIAFADVSGSMTSSFTFKDIFYQQGFSGADSDATATISVPASDFNGLFKLNIPVFDPAVGSSGVDTDSVRYLTKSAAFPDISFSEAVVDSGAIFTSHSDQTVKKDYLRSMLKDITGTTRLNNLFKNQNTMISNIQNLDGSFNEGINEVLTSINSAGWLTDADYGDIDGNTYTFDSVFSAYSYEDNSMADVSSAYNVHSASAFSKFNPLRILSSSILGEVDPEADGQDVSGSSLGNTDRREMLINSLATDVSAAWNGDFSTDTYSAVNSAGVSYRVAVTAAAATTDGNMNLAAEADGGNKMNGSVFSTYLKNLNVYAVAGTGATGGSLLDNVIDKEYDLEFIDGDKLHLLVTYKPQSSNYSLLSSDTPVNDRTYEIVLNMTA